MKQHNMLTFGILYDNVYSQYQNREENTREKDKKYNGNNAIGGANCNSYI